MITRELVKSLDPGDLVETQPLLAGLTEEPVTFMVEDRDPEGAEMRVTAMWMGITLSTFNVTVSPEHVAVWTVA